MEEGELLTAKMVVDAGEEGAAERLAAAKDELELAEVPPPCITTSTARRRSEAVTSGD